MRLTILKESGRDPKGYKLVLCQCECGTQVVAREANVKSGNTKSCGCLRTELRRSQTHARKHGQTGTPTYRSWRSMIQRCTDVNYTRFHDYGGRGIRVCHRWTKFENFLADMGERPEGMTLDRKENDLGYCLSNCRWATPTQQAANRRKRATN